MKKINLTFLMIIASNSLALSAQDISSYWDSPDGEVTLIRPKEEVLKEENTYLKTNYEQEIFSKTQVEQLDLNRLIGNIAISAELWANFEINQIRSNKLDFMENQKSLIANDLNYNIILFNYYCYRMNLQSTWKALHPLILALVRPSELTQYLRNTSEEIIQDEVHYPSSDEGESVNSRKKPHISLFTTELFDNLIQGSSKKARTKLPNDPVETINSDINIANRMLLQKGIENLNGFITEGIEEENIDNIAYVKPKYAEMNKAQGPLALIEESHKFMKNISDRNIYSAPIRESLHNDEESFIKKIKESLINKINDWEKKVCQSNSEEMHKAYNTGQPLVSAIKNIALTLKKSEY